MKRFIYFRLFGVSIMADETKEFINEIRKNKHTLRDLDSKKIKLLGFEKTLFGGIRKAEIPELSMKPYLVGKEPEISIEDRKRLAQNIINVQDDVYYKVAVSTQGFIGWLRKIRDEFGELPTYADSFVKSVKEIRKPIIRTRLSLKNQLISVKKEKWDPDAFLEAYKEELSERKRMKKVIKGLLPLIMRLIRSTGIEKNVKEKIEALKKVGEKTKERRSLAAAYLSTIFSASAIIGLAALFPDLLPFKLGNTFAHGGLAAMITVLASTFVSLKTVTKFLDPIQDTLKAQLTLKEKLDKLKI